jgi:DNA repair protein RadC
MRVHAIGVTHIRSMWNANGELTLQHPPEPFRICNAADAVELIGEDFSDFPVEILRLLHLRSDGHLIAAVEQVGGTDLVSISFSRLIREACTLGTHRLLLAHNHPSGDPTPSQADRTVTRRLAEILKLVEIELVDHLVFASQGIRSFRGMGLL